MKELPNMFARRYSAVSQKDDCVALDQNWQSKRYHPRKSLTQSFAIVDSFFSERKTGKRTRWPKCKLLFWLYSLVVLKNCCLTTCTQLLTNV